jgi:DNA-binding IclR family transcriptional regulator
MVRAMETDVDPKNIVGSIIKGSRLLDLYTTDRRELSLSEFSTETGFNKTTTYRLLQTLVAVGWLVRSASGGYRLGTRLLVLGAIARADLDLRREALPLMHDLADELGDTAFLMVPGPQGAVIIETVVGANPVQVAGLTPGSVLPYHVAAGPVALAAFCPDVEASVLATSNEEFTAHTATSRADLSRKLQDTRDQGYALSLEDYVEGVAAVGAPVLGVDGIAVATLSVGGPLANFSDARRDHTIALVTEAAAALSASLNA